MSNDKTAQISLGISDSSRRFYTRKELSHMEHIPENTLRDWQYQQQKLIPAIRGERGKPCLYTEAQRLEARELKKQGMNEPPPGAFSISDAAKITGYAKDTIRKMIGEGKLVPDVEGCFLSEAKIAELLSRRAKNVKSKASEKGEAITAESQPDGEVETPAGESQITVKEEEEAISSPPTVIAPDSHLAESDSQVETPAGESQVTVKEDEANFSNQTVINPDLALAESQDSAQVKTNAPRAKSGKKFYPMDIAPQFDNIPVFMKDLVRWIPWRLEYVSERLSKVPKKMIGGRLVTCSATDEKNYITYEEAVKIYQQGLSSGIGFCLTPGPPRIVCIDNDHCVLEDGSLNALSQEILKICAYSYTEFSQSGKGLHTFIHDEDFTPGKSRGSVELYGQDRFIAMTGVTIEGATELKTVCASREIRKRFLGSGDETMKPQFEITLDFKKNSTLSDADKDFVEYTRSDMCLRRDPMLYYLMQGEVDNYFKLVGKPEDDSAADFALAMKIYRHLGYQGSDDEIISRALAIFNESGLAKRPKWITRADYREMTLTKAFAKWKAKNPPDDLDELAKARRAVKEFESYGAAAVEKIKNLTEFSYDTVLDKEIIEAAAYAQIFDRKAYNALKADTLQYGKTHKDVKVDMHDLRAAVKEKYTEFEEKYSALKARVVEVQSRIETQKFFSANGLSNFVTPPGYSITEDGVFKLVDEKAIQICSSAVYIATRFYDTAQGIYRLELARQKIDKGFFQIRDVEQAVVFNNRKLVELANFNFPVTSSNAPLLVDFLDAFKAANESNLPLTYTVSHCGWHYFGGAPGQRIFVDPRRETNVTEDDKKIPVVVESNCEFATHLKTKGSFSAWKTAYELVSHCAIARAIVALSMVSPLLDILGERNFVTYIAAPTTAGKTTLLELAASAIGSPEMIRSLDITRMGLNALAAQRNHYGLLVDEKQVADEKLAEKLAQIIYSHSNGMGRSRCNRTGGLNITSRWRNIMVLTGEGDWLNDAVTGGAWTRSLQIKYNTKIVAGEICGKIKSIIKDNYGHVLPLFIKEVESLGDSYLNTIYKMIVENLTFEAQTLQRSLQPEHIRYIALITLSDIILNTVNVNDWNDVFFESLETISQLIMLVPCLDEISDTKREADFLSGFIAQNQSRFIGGNVAPDKMQQIYGKIIPDETKTESAKETWIIPSALKEACRQKGFDYQKLVSDLQTAGVIEPKTPTRWLGKSSVRCYIIHNYKLIEITSGGEPQD